MTFKEWKNNSEIYEGSLMACDVETRAAWNAALEEAAQKFDPDQILTGKQIINEIRSLKETE